MKVLLFTSIYPSLGEPTRGPYNHNIFCALSSHCETRVISPQPFWSRLREPQKLFDVPREDQTGIDTLLPTFWSVPKVAMLHARAMYASMRPIVERLHRDFPFDVIFAAWAYPDGVAASLLARDYDCPLVVKTLGSDINELAKSPSLRRQIQRGMQSTQRVVTVSDALRNKVIDLGVAPEQVVTQHNGVDGEKFFLRDVTTVRRQLNLPVDRTTLCYVGRLGQEKGLDVLIEAIGHLGRPDVDLHLIGGGETEEALRDQVRHLQLQSQVHFHGMRPHDEVPLWVSACDVLCLPSRREGCPNVVLEALASGRPVVASNVGGVPELINAENGVLVPSEDPRALAQGLQQALTRTWEPQRLRDSVEFLSWNDVGAMYYHTLVASLEEWNSRPQKRLPQRARPERDLQRASSLKPD